MNSFFDQGIQGGCWNFLVTMKAFSILLWNFVILYLDLIVANGTGSCIIRMNL